jgi:hypothetical protein
MRLSRNLFQSTIFASALMVAFLIAATAVQAQTSTTPSAQDPDETGWHVAITPYLWLAGMHGTVGALGHDASVHASAGDIFSYVNIGAMGALETRYNRIVMPIDFMWIKLSDDKGIPVDDEVDSIKVKLTQTVITPKIGYRVVDGKRVKVDALFGVRYFHFKNSLTLQPVQEGGGFSDSVNWVDAVAGGKIEAMLTPKVVLTIAGDAGGGGARSDYQVAGLLGYKLNRKCILQAGYRYLSVNYRPQSTFVYDVTQSGIVLGATINLK